MAPTNNAALFVAKATPLKLQTVLYTAPRDDEIVVRNAAVAINPFDWIIQSIPGIIAPYVKLPFVLGTDVAGEVVEIGKRVTRFAVGDRVVAYAIGLDKSVNRACEGAFQDYTVLRQNVTSAIPDFMSYEAACVLPLGLSTAACALFQKDYLALPYPSANPTASGKTVLVWGGSTSVGCNAIQLAVASGCQVITTASPKNHAYLKKLGAIEVFDYNSPTVVKDIVLAFTNRRAAGAISIGRGSFKKCVEVLGACKGNKFIAQATLDLPPMPQSSLGLASFGISIMGTSISGSVSARLKGVGFKFLNGSDLLTNEVGDVIFRQFLPGALESRRYVPAPEPQIVGKGLKYVQEAMDMSRKGVSLKKLVVTL